MIRPDVPLMQSTLNESTRPIYLRQIKEAGAERVWIAMNRSTLFCDRSEYLSELSCSLRFFEENGIECGVWIQAFGFGDPLS